MAAKLSCQLKAEDASFAFSASAGKAKDGNADCWKCNQSLSVRLGCWKGNPVQTKSESKQRQRNREATVVSASWLRWWKCGVQLANFKHTKLQVGLCFPPLAKLWLVALTTRTASAIVGRRRRCGTSGQITTSIQWKDKRGKFVLGRDLVKHTEDGMCTQRGRERLLLA